MSEVARVIETSRRFITLRRANGEYITARSSTKTLSTFVGDLVKFSSRADDFVVDSILPRQNELRRTYGSQSKALAVNLDLLVIVTAVQPLFNRIFVDRISLAAQLENIPSLLILNKIDIDENNTKEDLAIYENLNFKILRTSAVSGVGIPELSQLISQYSDAVIAMAGISGVGKSSLLNCLIPEANRRTAEVSAKTGQGRQTTSQATAYVFDRPYGGSNLIIDLPGFSTFGVGHLNMDAVRTGFLEFANYAASCRYTDCYHTDEPLCAVKQAIDAGEISPSRYQSYLDILQEIKAAQPY